MVFLDTLKSTHFKYISLEVFYLLQAFFLWFEIQIGVEIRIQIQIGCFVVFESQLQSDQTLKMNYNYLTE